MQREKFLKYNPQVAIKLLIDLARELDLNWGDEEHDRRIIALREVLSWCEDHDEAVVSRLTRYQRLLQADMTKEDLFCFLVPFEREYTRGIVDHEFIPSEGDGSDVCEFKQKHRVQLVLDNIRSAFNVGSIFRTAECFGVSRIFVCGYTATPEHEKTSKTSMGTAQLIPWVQKDATKEAILSLQESGVRVIAVETVSTATSLVDIEFTDDTAFVLGNERYGLSSDILKLCDGIVKVPMLGTKNSLNVGVCLGVCLGELSRQMLSKF